MRSSKTRLIAAVLALAALPACVLGVARLVRRPVLEGVSFSQEVLDREGRLLRLTLSTDQKYRIRTKLEEIDPRYLEALLELEDRHFYSHPGFNPVAALRAARSYLFGGPRMGASTLTMQLARVRYGLPTRTISGKLRQIATALVLEATHSKQELLEAYVNLAPFGANLEGVGAASRIYFGKSPRDLTLGEVLSLAVIPQSPTQRQLSAGGVVRTGSLVNARGRLLERWLERHPGDRERAGDLRLPLAAQRLKELPYLAPHFVEMALKAEPRAARINTSLDLELQLDVERRLKSHVAARVSQGIRNAAALVVDTRTAEVVALVGSRDYFDDSIGGQVNGVAARRSPGSTLKPFIYALALQSGIIHSRTLLKDVPTSFGGYDPENIDSRYVGPLAAEDALVQSRNLPAVELASRLQNPTVYEFLKAAHVSLPRDSRHYGLGVALGGAEVSMWELAQLYVMLARLGDWAPLSVTLSRGPTGKSERLLTREAAYVTLEMLTKNPRPDRTYTESWARATYPVAWKTGTSSGFHDAWSAGVAGPYVIVAWVGNFDNEPNQSFLGREAAGPLLFSIADGLAARKNLEAPPWRQAHGLNLRKVEVCALSGFLRGPHCKHGTEAWFIPGVSPIAPCEIHRAIRVDRVTGLRLCDSAGDLPEGGGSQRSSREEVYEFWPTDLASLFRTAGVARKSPPRFAPGCEGGVAGDGGRAPRIVSPRDAVKYLESVSTSAELNTINLKAVADADVRTLYWFVNQRFLARSAPGGFVPFPAKAGDYVVSVVDDLGRSDSRNLVVRAAQ